jgi:DNA-binding IclR family transcriptional regulator
VDEKVAINMSGDDASDPFHKGTQSIDRTTKIISYIASYNVEGVRLVDIASSLNLSRPTAYRILQFLVTEGWVMRPQNSQKYFLGHSLFELGLTAAPQFKFRDLCQSSLERVARKTQHVSFLTIRSGIDAISIARSKGAIFELSALQIGVHRPLGIGAGSLALLMHLPDDEVSNIVMKNARRLRSFADMNISTLLESVKLCRSQGFASHDERILRGHSGAAVPITDVAGNILGAISVTVVAPSISQEELYEIISILRKESKNIKTLLSDDIGYAAERVRLLTHL